VQTAGTARVVTPEGVVLDLPTAGIGSRVAARLLDLLLMAVATYAFVLAFTVLVLLGTSVVAVVVAAFFSVGVMLVYPVLMEGLWGGRTLGKAAIGLRVVRLDGGPVALRHAAARGALGLLEVWATLGFVGLVTMVLSSRDQRLGDMVAGTLVLRERRDGSLQPVELLVPPGCEQLVRDLDVGAMTDGDYEVVRAFLTRWREFPQAERPAVAARLAAPLWQRFKHPVPPWLGPDYYLACLGAAYQLRRPVARLSPQGRLGVPASSWGNPQPWGSPAASWQAVPPRGGGQDSHGDWAAPP
jgi:uncharacterized RDD family membrane protein YckC